MTASGGGGAPIKPEAAAGAVARLAPGWLDWAGVALITACGALAALVEALLVPLFVGRLVAPVSVVLALASNAALPWLAGTLVPRPVARLAPFLAWLIVMIGFGVVARPEGDVILPGSPGNVVWVTYVVLLGGALVGTVTLVWLSPPPATKRPLSR